MLASLLAFVILIALTATAQSASQLILWRLLTSLGASGVVPLALALMDHLFPYEQRGRPLGSYDHPAVFAFYPNKQVTTGEGGAVAVHDEQQ